MSSKPKQQSATTSKTQNTNSTSQTTPWGPASGHLNNIADLAGDAFAQSGKYDGDLIAPPTEGQRSAVQQFYGVAPTLNQGAGDLRSTAQRIASGEFLDVNNPILAQAREAAINPVEKRLREDILPSITDASIRGGAYGGTAPAVLEGKALGDFGRAASDIGAGMNLDWINQRFNDVFQSPELFGAANTLDLAPGMTTMMGGDYERGLDQLLLDNEANKWALDQQQLWGPLQNYYNIINGLAGGYGTKTTTGTGTSQGETVQTGAEPDMMTQLLQGGLGAAGILAGLSGAFPMTMAGFGLR